MSAMKRRGEDIDALEQELHEQKSRFEILLRNYASLETDFDALMVIVKITREEYCNNLQPPRELTRAFDALPDHLKNELGW